MRNPIAHESLLDFQHHDAVDAMERALRMPKKEMQRRMKALREEVLELDVHRWADDYLKLLEHG